MCCDGSRYVGMGVAGGRGSTDVAVGVAMLAWESLAVRGQLMLPWESLWESLAVSKGSNDVGVGVIGVSEAWGLGVR